MWGWAVRAQGVEISGGVWAVGIESPQALSVDGFWAFKVYKKAYLSSFKSGYRSAKSGYRSSFPRHDLSFNYL